MKFFKYHALGNDYIVIDPAHLSSELTLPQIQTLCHRNYGVGSDGILLGPSPSSVADFKLRIFNPDGSEAEKSGNGLRLFSRFLWDQKKVTETPFSIETLGGVVTCQMEPDGKMVQVEMGQVSFSSLKIPVTGPHREVLNEHLSVGGKTFEYCAATIGNPHCVILNEDPTKELANKFGPLIEREERFPNGTNVQFLKVLNQNHIQIEIWERGAGYTLASGSSSTAAAAVAFKLGLVKSEVKVSMPGGHIQIQLTQEFHARMTGPTTRVAEGQIALEIFSL